MKEKIHKAITDYPSEVEEMVYEWYEKMPELAEIAIDAIIYGKHLFDNEMYNKAIKLLKNVDGTASPHWTVEQVEAKANTDFDTKDYTLHDLAYIMNMLFSDYGNIFTDTSYYMKMAINYLTDPDYCGEPSERAFYDAKKRLEYNKE